MQLGELTLNIIINLSEPEGKIKSFTTKPKGTDNVIKKLLYFILKRFNDIYNKE